MGSYMRPQDTAPDFGGARGDVSLAPPLFCAQGKRRVPNGQLHVNRLLHVQGFAHFFVYMCGGELHKNLDGPVAK